MEMFDVVGTARCSVGPLLPPTEWPRETFSSFLKEENKRKRQINFVSWHSMRADGAHYPLPPRSRVPWVARVAVHVAVAEAHSAVVVAYEVAAHVAAVVVDVAVVAVDVAAVADDLAVADAVAQVAPVVPSVATVASSKIATHVTALTLNPIKSPRWDLTFKTPKCRHPTGRPTE